MSANASLPKANREPHRMSSLTPSGLFSGDYSALRTRFLAAARTAYPAAVAGYDGLTEELEFDREP